MTYVAIFSTIGMTIQAFFTDADGMDLFIFAKAFVLLIIVAAPAIHRKRIFLLRGIPMVARIALQANAVGRGVGGMIEKHTSVGGLKFHGLGLLDGHEILRIMAKSASHRTGNVTGFTIIRNTAFMDRVIGAYFTIFFAVVALPAIHGGGFALPRGGIMMTHLALDTLQGGVQTMIENHTSPLGIKGYPDRFLLLLKPITQDSNDHQHNHQHTQELLLSLFCKISRPFHARVSLVCIFTCKGEHFPPVFTAINLICLLNSGI
jgi:hypothetical protein